MVVMTMLCLAPHATSVTPIPLSDFIILGNSELRMEPWPSWPFSPSPQLNVSPSTDTHRVWSAPQLRFLMIGLRAPENTTTRGKEEVDFLHSDSETFI